MDFHIGHTIRDELHKQEKTVTWFARQINCTRTHAYRIFEKDNLDLKLIAIISKVLQRDLFCDLSEAYFANNVKTPPLFTSANNNLKS